MSADRLYQPLPYKALKFKHAHQHRVAAFDPTIIYQRLQINQFRRHQVDLKFADAFPPIDGQCSCGCGNAFPKRRRRWASDDCVKFALEVWAVIDGQTEIINRYVAKYNGRVCARCRCRKGLKVDHVIPVKHGGGGCWLSNYQLLCHDCHVQKTNEDFGRGAFKNIKEKEAA